MKYLSLFSGIEAATLAWHPLGWKAVAFAQYDPDNDYSKGPDFPSAVLSHHWPSIPNLGDVTKITPAILKKIEPFDLVVFGSPCQDLSIAGKRKGLEGQRSGLFKTAIKIIRWAIKYNGCRFALWENVPGSFSSNEGADFCEVLSALSGSQQPKPKKWGGAGCCFGKIGLVEWATFDAQFFGVPQRRRRVFVFADFGNWTNRQPIFSDCKGVSGDIEQGRETGENPAETLKTITRDSGQREDGKLIAYDMLAFGVYGEGITASTCKARDYKDATDLVVYPIHDQATRFIIRRLTPIECERLQGMPDNHTMIPWRGKPPEECPDGLRYQAIGNSMAVPVMRWIGEQIDTIH